MGLKGSSAWTIDFFISTTPTPWQSSRLQRVIKGISPKLGKIPKPLISFGFTHVKTLAKNAFFFPGIPFSVTSLQVVQN